MTLIELLIAMLIATMLIAGLLHIVSAARISFRLQESLAEIQESERFAIYTLGNAIRQAEFHPEPWQDGSDSLGISANTLDGMTQNSDRVAVRTRSDLNCFDNANPVKDVSGRAAFYLKESIFDLNGKKDLTHTCRYGPDAFNYKTQINRQGLVRNVESFHALFAEDTDQDGNADRWVKGGQWQREKDVLGIQIGMLLSSSESVLKAQAQVIPVLDAYINAPADGKLRRVVLFTSAIKGRKG